MKRKKPIGIIILIMFYTLSLLGYVCATIMGYLLGWEISLFQRFMGIIFMIAGVLSIYYFVNPSEFGRHFILITIGLSTLNMVIQSVIYKHPKHLEMYNTAQLEKYNFINLFVSLVLSILVLVYIYSKKDYFTDNFE